MKLAEECKINGVHVVSVDIRGGQLTADYALVCHTVNPDTGEKTTETHGKCFASAVAWSKETIEHLNSLLASMENDLLKRHFKDAEGEETHGRTFLGGLEATPQV